MHTSNNTVFYSPFVNTTCLGVENIIETLLYNVMLVLILPIVRRVLLWTYLHWTYCIQHIALNTLIAWNNTALKIKLLHSTYWLEIAHSTYCIKYIAFNLLHSTYRIIHTALNILHGTYYDEHRAIAVNTLHSTYWFEQIAFNTLHSCWTEHIALNILLSTYWLEHIVFNTLH